MTDGIDEPASPHGDGGLRRLRLDLAYDGTAFSCWARQPQRRTVEGVLVDALVRVGRLRSAPALVVAGRTDAGVHALGQVAHADLPRSLDPVRLAARLRWVLPPDVVLRALAVAPEGFDARFSACARAYRYRVTDGEPDPLRRHDTLAWRRALDAEVMDAAVARLLGGHDFAAFCRARP